MKLETKMEWILLAVGLVVGGASGFGIAQIGKQPVKHIEVVTESKVGNKLADIDLVKVPCSKDFIKEYSDLLCRELFCRMQQRGIDSKTSTVDCSGISNLNNTLRLIDIIEKSCDIKQEDTDKYNKCTDRYMRILTTGKSGQ